LLQFGRVLTRKKKENNVSSDQDVIEIEFDGKRFLGFYSVEKGVVTVNSQSHGSKAAKVCGSNESSIARILLREIMQQAKTNGIL
jgi:hypothetical protein